MGTINIAIKDDVYEMSVKEKRVGESFSDELRRVFASRKGKNIMKHLGAWKNMSKGEIADIKKGARLARENFSTSRLKEIIKLSK